MMEKLEQLRKQLEIAGEKYKESIEDATKINEQMDEILLNGAKSAIKGESFTLKVSGAVAGKEQFVLIGSDRVVLKLMPFRTFGLVIRLGDQDHILAVDSGTIFLPLIPDLDLVTSLNLRIDTKVLDDIIIGLTEARDKLMGEREEDQLSFDNNGGRS